MAVIGSGMECGPSSANDMRDMLTEGSKEEASLHLWKLPGQALLCAECEWGNMWPASSWQLYCGHEESQAKDGFEWVLSCWVSLSLIGFAASGCFPVYQASSGCFLLFLYFPFHSSSFPSI